MESDLLNAVGNPLNYGALEVLVNLGLAVLLGLLLGVIYRFTHKGVSYSQSFTLTIVFITVIVAMVMMVIGSSLARAFALVGALSIIRFRTVVKDTKDTAYVFAGLAVGMAAGTSNYYLALVGSVVVCALAVTLHKLNFGALYKSDIILRFSFDQSHRSEAYLERIQEFARHSNLLHIEPTADGAFLRLTYDIDLQDGVTAQQLSAGLAQVEGVSDVVLIASKSDVDY